jgi:heat shock protein HtpX
MKRVLLFLGTNLAIIVVASITLNLLGVGSFLDETGTGLNLQALLIFCFIFGCLDLSSPCCCRRRSPNGR